MDCVMKSDRKQHTFDCAEAAMFRNRLECHHFSEHGYYMIPTSACWHGVPGRKCERRIGWGVLHAEGIYPEDLSSMLALNITSTSLAQT